MDIIAIFIVFFTASLTNLYYIESAKHEAIELIGKVNKIKNETGKFPNEMTEIQGCDKSCGRWDIKYYNHKERGKVYIQYGAPDVGVRVIHYEFESKKWW